MKVLKLILWPIILAFFLVKSFIWDPIAKAWKRTNGSLFGYPERRFNNQGPRFIDGDGCGQHRHRRGHRGGKKHHPPRQTRW